MLKENRELCRKLLHGFEAKRKRRHFKLESLLRRQNHKNVVLVMLVNHGHLDLFRNWVRSCDDRGIEVRSWTLVFTVDADAAHGVEQLGFTYYTDPTSYGDHSKEAVKVFGDFQFRLLMFQKTAIVKDVLDLGYRVLFQDVDVVWMKNPLAYFLHPSRQGYDAWFMYDGPNRIHAPLRVNTGFFWLNPTPESIRFWSDVLKHYHLILQSGSQQMVVNQIIVNHIPTGLKLSVLLEKDFANGHLFSIKSTEKLPNDPYVIHCSWTRNLQHKIKKFKFSQLWFLDDNQNTTPHTIKGLGRRSAAGTNQGSRKELKTARPTGQGTKNPKKAKVTCTKRPAVKFVVGIEDKPYFYWQLPILIESLYKKLPQGWELIVVVCNNHKSLSESLTQVFHAYKTKYFTTTNYPRNENIDFAGGGDCYVAINRIQALSAVAHAVNPDDLICLLETDIFLYKNLNINVIPTTNSLAKNLIIQQELFFSWKQDPKGVNLSTLLAAMCCHQTFAPGGVTLFLSGATIQNHKFIRDCFRFAQILYLMGKIIGVKKVWMSEMPCFALALTMNGIPYDVIDDPEFSTLNLDDPIIRPGTFYHYYHDLRDGEDGAFYGSKWYKQLFWSKNFLQEDISYWSSRATSQHEKYFFELAKKARLRLHVSNYYIRKEKEIGKPT